MKINSIRVHDGVFHADDVCVVALLEALRDRCMQDPTNNYDWTWNNCMGSRVFITRSRTAPAIEEDLVADVGNGPYDHHDRSFNRYYANGIKYAAVGLVLENLDIDPKLKQSLLDLGLYAVQAQDNGQQGILEFVRDGEHVTTDLNKLPNPFTFVRSMNATWQEGGVDSPVQLHRFSVAVNLAKEVIKRLIAIHDAAVAAEKEVKGYIKTLDADDSVLVMPKFFNGWQKWVIEANQDRSTKIIGCVFPGQGDNWNVQVVPKENGSFEALSKHPDDWCGLSGKELTEKSQILDGVFCHKAGFMSVWGDKDSAITAAQHLIKL
jgi:uncharacterized UPF0160 family protein